jgi:hypothetical protein
MLGMKESISMARKMAKEYFTGLTYQSTRETLKIITLMARASTHGQMEGNLMVSGRITKCMVTECLLGKTEGNM